MTGEIGPCLDADMAAAYIAHALDAAERQLIDDHLDGCPRCRQLVSAVVSAALDVDSNATAGANASASVSAAARAVGDVLPRGSHVGPYVVETVVDAGGMGVIYAARDHRLGRSVALKVLHDAKGDDLERVIAEAAAMAQLSHPNIVAVHDVLEHDGRAYIAMELVTGGNVRRWLEHTRTWREIVDLFVDIGEALAAVHDADLVHADVKPANILLGSDGRARLGDFGLAKLEGPAGTPAYLAPELRDGAHPDAKSDQYSLCASLYEALYGALPGSASTHRSTGAVPRRARRAIERGLRDDPAQRFPSVRALVGELRAARRARRRMIGVAIGVAIGATVATSVIVAMVMAQRTSNARATMSACEAGGSLDAIWDDAARHQVERGLRASRAPYADSTWKHVQTSLDTWVSAYAGEIHGACSATWIDGDQSTARLEARLSCLAERRRELRGVIDELARADVTTASYAAAATRLRAPSTCAREPASVAGSSATGSTTDDGPARIRALVATGHARDALPLARAEVAAAATRAEDQRRHADALLLIGMVEAEVSDLDAGEAHLLEAITLAERADSRWIAAAAWLRMLRIEQLRGRGDRLALYRPRAEAAVLAAGNDPNQRATLLHYVGTILAAQGNRDEAKRVLRDALAADPDAPGWERGAILESLAIADEIAGDARSAIGPLVEARAAIEAGLGASHPRLGYSYENLAVAWFDSLEPARARGEMVHALDIFQNALGTHRSTAIAHDVMGFIELEVGNIASARRHHDEAMRIWVALGLAHPRKALTFLGLSQVALVSGDFAAAVRDGETARLLGRELPDAKDRAMIALQLARALDASKRDRERARDLAREAADIYASHVRSPRDERDGSLARSLAR